MHRFFLKAQTTWEHSSTSIMPLFDDLPINSSHTNFVKLFRFI
jgi:hypothetical protein